jgi:hypothetical protein
MRHGLMGFGALCVSVLSFACASDDSPAADATVGTSYLDDLEATGLLAYLGAYEPSDESASASGTATIFSFAVTEDGPKCIDGDAYAMSVRDQGSENLVIYLQGGGACWPGLESCTRTASPEMPLLGLFDAADPESPTGSWNHVYVPYCDGSVFIGDGERAGAIHHGLKNLSAALDVAKSQFSAAKRVVVAGSSAGGLGTIWGTGLVRKLFPEAEILVLNDAGLGLSRPDDPEFRSMLEEAWGSGGRAPASCAECQASVHTTPLVGWTLRHDPNIKAAAFSSYADSVIAGVFLQIPAAEFKEVLLDVTGKIHDEFPDRYERFFIEGTQHTALRQWETTEKNGVTFKAWTTAMINGDAAWDDRP